MRPAISRAMTSLAERLIAKSYYPFYPLLRVISSFAILPPVPRTKRFNAPCGFQIARQKPNYFAADANADTFQIDDAEFADGGFNGVFDQSSLYATPGLERQPGAVQW